MRFRVEEEGTYWIKAYQQSFSENASFTARPIIMPIIPVPSQTVEDVVGEEAATNPLFFVVLILSFMSLAAFSAVQSFSMFKGAKENLVLLAMRMAFVAGYSIVPILASKFLGMFMASAIIIVQIIALFALRQFTKKN